MLRAGIVVAVPIVGSGLDDWFVDRMPRRYGRTEILCVSVNELTTDRSGKDCQRSDGRKGSEKGEAGGQANHLVCVCVEMGVCVRKRAEG